jgi:serine/threonine-protein kinase
VSELSIFVAALDLADPAARAAYLDEACAADPALRRRVEDLLAADDRTGSFMDRPAPELIPPTAPVSETADLSPAGGGATATRPAEPTPFLAVRPLAPEALPALLRRRLRLAVLIMTGFFLAGWCLGIVNLALHDWVVPRRLRGQMVFFGGITAALVALTVLLWSCRPLSLARLRVTELSLVALFALGCVWKQLTTLDFVPDLVLGHGGSPAVMVLASYHALFWFALLAMYGLFVPNSWRRCAVVVAGIAVCPLVVALVQAARPDAELAGRPLLYYLTALCCWSVFGASLAVFGSHHIGELRQAAAEARRLGPYVLVRKLGAGGMGEVHLAEHRLLKRPCAVKLIRPDRADATAVRRFEREVQAATRLSHPAAVQVYDYGQSDDGTFYYVMEYLPGLTLDAVTHGGPLPPGRVVHVMRQVCGALAEAHALGLVHRDVKPGNVMLCRLGGRADAAKLLDFGLVSAAGPGDDRLTRTGGILGTPAFMSPEQARGAGAGPAADVYALGAVGYFLSTCRPPFAGKNSLEVLHAHLSAAVVPPSELNPAVPADLEAVFLRCLTKDPAGRFDSAAALDAALAGCGCAADWSEADAADWWDATAPGAFVRAEGPP